jgi:hypothetical protein
LAGLPPSCAPLPLLLLFPLTSRRVQQHLQHGARAQRGANDVGDGLKRRGGRSIGTPRPAGRGGAPPRLHALPPASYDAAHIPPSLSHLGRRDVAELGLLARLALGGRRQDVDGGLHGDQGGGRRGRRVRVRARRVGGGRASPGGRGGKTNRGVCKDGAKTERHSPLSLFLGLCGRPSIPHTLVIAPPPGMRSTAARAGPSGRPPRAEPSTARWLGQRPQQQAAPPPPVAHDAGVAAQVRERGRERERRRQCRGAPAR